MKKSGALLVVVTIIFSFFSCTQEHVAVVEGTIKNANGVMLYIEHIGKGKPSLVDTIVLNENGSYKFRPTVEKGGPDYFCLRLSTQTIPFVIDSTLTPVTIDADMKTFATHYNISGDVNNRIKDVTLLGNKLRKSILNLNSANNGSPALTQEVYADSVRALIKCYKDSALSYIYNNPSDPVAYYILFQSVGGLSIFDPYDAVDNKAFGAVATGWQYNYGNSPRTSQLVKMTIEGQNLRRLRHEREMQNDSLLAEKINVKNYFEVILPNKEDMPVSLSSVIDKSRVVLLDFTSFSLQSSVSHNMALAKIYDKYRESGFEIYQVCLDLDENFWKVAASNLNWTVVRDRDVEYDGSSLYSRTASTYNVTKLPTMYLLGEDGSIEANVVKDEDLESALKKLL